MKIPKNLLDREYMTNQLIEAKILDEKLTKSTNSLVEKYSEYLKLSESNPSKKYSLDDVDHRIEAYANNIQCHVFEYNSTTDKKESSKANNLLFYYHGGGWVLGSAKNGSFNLCQNMAKFTESTVISVEYNLAPEFPFSDDLKIRNAFSDCYNATLDYLQRNTNRNKNNKFGLIGDSAGGNLCLAVGLKFADQLEENDELMPSFIAPVYPVTNCTDFETESYRPNATSKKQFCENDHLTRKQMIEFITLYLLGYKATNDMVEKWSQSSISHQLQNLKIIENLSKDSIFPALKLFSPFASPIKAPDSLWSKFLNNLKGKIYFYIAEHDVLRDDSEILVEKLKKLSGGDSKIEVFLVEGQLHGSFRVCHDVPDEMRENFEKSSEFLKKLKNCFA